MLTPTALLMLSVGLAACGTQAISGADSSPGSDADPNELNARAAVMPQLDELLTALRGDRDGAMLGQNRHAGWPATVDGGYLFVSTEGLPLVASDHDNWAGAIMTELYAHDGQNLFNPGALFGGWNLDEAAPTGMTIVGIDNDGGQRLAEYSHTDEFGTTSRGDAYAAYVQDTVRPLVRQYYGEPEEVGTIGASLCGLIALHIADRYPGKFDLVASLSGTLGWGSIDGQGTDTIIARDTAAGHRSTAIYLDSGGNGETCADTDSDGTNDDDDTAGDNYCETRQMETTLLVAGYQYNADLWHWYEPGAPHNEAAWAARVFRPLQEFMSL
ncbi:MAG: hypothetical protein GY811_20415 [Myxococcales bacterium]|nr:hypothetical protein [Myxococcales bacterium]